MAIEIDNQKPDRKGQRFLDYPLQNPSSHIFSEWVIALQKMDRSVLTLAKLGFEMTPRKKIRRFARNRSPICLSESYMPSLESFWHITGGVTETKIVRESGLAATSRSESDNVARFCIRRLILADRVSKTARVKPVQSPGIYPALQMLQTRRSAHIPMTSRSRTSMENSDWVINPPFLAPNTRKVCQFTFLQGKF
jgi:hypothetical protein